jgi:hypothetical protein
MGIVQSTHAIASPGALVMTLNGVSSSNVLIALYSSSQIPTAGGALTGGTWTAANAPAQFGASDVASATIFVNTSPSAGTNTVTTNNGGANFTVGVLVEWSGLTASPVDVAPSPGNATTAQANSVSSGVLAQANEVVFAVLCLAASTGVANAGITDPPTGFTSLFVDSATNADQGAEFCYQIVSATSSVSANWTWTDASTAHSQATMASFKIAAAATASIAWVT